ncbi:MAG: hypothetical protein APR54_04550 [Candidatus Cloacimonas sp. SDB]|nr:MAG: hypothetical protein APR54_04550 [Candidatus Cloacimonas sp. SDB]
MISSGIFILPSLAFSQLGSAVFIAYFIAGILGLLGMLSIVELSTAMPKAGGDYFFINKSLGPLFGTISGFLGWLALSLKSAFAIFGIAEIILLYFGFDPLISGLFLCLFFVGMNIIGVKQSALFQILMLLSLLLLLIIYIFFGFSKVDLGNFSSLRTVRFNDILITSGFVFIAFGGLLKVANVSEEIKNPKKNIPLGMLSSIIVITILYTFITFILTGTLDPEVFRNSLTPVADSARNIMGNPGFVMIIIAAILAFFTTANAGIMAASRYPIALARDNLIPHSLARISKKHKTPVISIILTGILLYVSLLLPLEMLVKAASTVILTSYVLTNLSVIILRESKIINYKPSFKSPLYPWLQIVCIILFSFFIFELGVASIELSLSFLFLCTLIYMLYGRKMYNREYALLHLMKRITDKRLMENVFEDELREILVDRENIEQDNFDNLIKNADIIDIDDPMNFEELLKIVAEKIADKANISKNDIISRFLERQNECNMAITDFFAIPHIMIEGEEIMFLTIVRSKKGIRFTEKENEVKAVFFLGGTKEKRALHLKTIAAIATLVGTEDFQENWLKTENSIKLKNLMILSNRKRFH